MLAFSTAANAQGQLQPLVSGQSITFSSADNLGANYTPTGTQQASINNQSFTFTGSNGAQTVGTYSVAAYQNTNGAYDFYYQFTNSSSSTDVIAGFSATSFAGYTTSVGYTTAVVNAADGFTASTYAAGGPSSVNRTGSSTSPVAGKTLQYDFTQASNQGGVPNNGTSSVTLVVRTNASSYTSGTLGIAGPVPGGVSGFVASGAALPEPGALMMAGLGLLGFGFVRRRKSI